MFSVTISKQDEDAFKEQFGKESKDRIRQGLALVRQEWQQEFVRQDERNQKTWTPLKTWVGGTLPVNPKRLVGGIDRRSYSARKRRDYYRGKTKGGQVRYLRILKRTGVMLQRYISGISINNTSLTITIPFPSGDVGKRAMSHQGYNSKGEPVGLPKGVLAHRPFDTQRFLLTANRIIRRELNKS